MNVPLRTVFANPVTYDHPNEIHTIHTIHICTKTKKPVAWIRTLYSCAHVCVWVCVCVCVCMCAHVLGYMHVCMTACVYEFCLNTIKISRLACKDKVQKVLYIYMQEKRNNLMAWRKRLLPLCGLQKFLWLPDKSRSP